MSDYQETLYDGYGQRFRMDRLLHEVRTEHQHLVIFENARMGRVMALDGVIQTTEADEFIYHEMLTHVPILAHGAAKRAQMLAAELPELFKRLRRLERALKDGGRVAEREEEKGGH